MNSRASRSPEGHPTAGSSASERPWWAPTAPREPGPPDLALTDAEHLICLRVGRRANEGAFNVPSVPAVAAEAVAMLSAPEPEADRVARIIGRDQQLAADVIFFANSSRFAGVMKVTNIPQALARVGIPRTINLILAASMRRLVFDGCERSRAEQLWLHSIGCAAIAACIARNVRSDPHDAYLAGLFHDVGKPIAMSLLDPATVKGPLAALRPEFVEHVIDLYHEGLGAAVAVQWRLPEHVSEVVCRHSEDEVATFTKAQAVVALADNCCHRLRIGAPDDQRPIASRVTLDALGAEWSDLGQVLEGVRAASEAP